MSRTRQAIGIGSVAACALTLVLTGPATSSPAAPIAAGDQHLKPYAAGSVQIDAAGLAGGNGDVTVVVDPLPGFDDATVLVSGTGDADVSGGATAVPTEVSTASASVTIGDGSESAADPSVAALADASGSTVVATLTATAADGTVRSTSDTVWVDAFEGEILVSEIGEQDLRLQRVAVLADAGTITASEAEVLNQEIRGGGAATTESFVPGTCVDLCVSGTVLWTDSAGATHPVDRAPVEIRDEETGADQVVTTVTTDANGAYSATIDNDDGDATGRDLYVRVRANGPGFTIAQFIDSTVDADVPTGGEVTHDLTANNSEDNNTAFAVHASLVFARDYLVTLHGTPFPTVPVVFPASGSFFDGTSLHLLRLDRWDWDVSLHEYGHFIADRINIENNPGGPHSTGNLSDQRGRKSIGIPLAFGEGWPTYFAVSALHETAGGLGIPNVGDTVYQDTEDQVVNADLEATSTFGEDSEDTVMDVLWDLFDAVDDGRDHTSLGAQAVWDTLDDNDPTTLSAAYRVFSPAKADEGVNCIFTQMNVSPRLAGPASVNLAANAPTPTLTWARGNGGTHRNNSFLVKYRNNAGGLIFSSPAMNTTRYTPTTSRWTTIRNQAGGVVRVSVIGRQADSPATGPYRSCSKEFVLS